MKKQVYNRYNCPCNFCKYMKIDANYVYVCSRRNNKPISALNLDIEYAKVVSDNEVRKCRCFYLDPLSSIV